MGRERERWEREVTAREKSNERKRSGGGGAHGARGARAGLGQAGPGWVTPRVKTHDTHNHQTDSDREPKSQMGRDKHATNHDIIQRNMLQHDATPMTFRFCFRMTQTPATTLL
jgi:hypothetical protein